MDTTCGGNSCEAHNIKFSAIGVIKREDNLSAMEFVQTCPLFKAPPEAIQ